VSDEAKDVEAGDTRTVRPFADWLLEQANGSTHAELTAQLNELVQSAIAHGKGGELTLSVKVKPATKGAGNMLLVTADVKSKLPRGERPDALFYADRDGNLRRDNPDQLKFEGLREVPRPDTATPKEAEAQ
jgi:hypothetical protein